MPKPQPERQMIAQNPLEMQIAGNGPLTPLSLDLALGCLHVHVE